MSSSAPFIRRLQPSGLSPGHQLQVGERNRVLIGRELDEAETLALRTICSGIRQGPFRTSAPSLVFIGRSSRTLSRTSMRGHTRASNGACGVPAAVLELPGIRVNRPAKGTLHDREAVERCTRFVRGDGSLALPVRRKACKTRSLTRLSLVMKGSRFESGRRLCRVRPRGGTRGPMFAGNRSSKQYAVGPRARVCPS